MHNIYMENNSWLILFWSLINAMEGLRRSQSCLLAAIPMCFLFLLNSTFCWSLNDEGAALLKFKEKVVSDPYGALSNWRYEKGVETPCSWFGVGCSEGYVVVLNLKDLCLNGTLSPDIGYLVRVKFIILRNNSFSGAIPREVVDLKDLEVLDLSHNNISGQLPCGLGRNLFTGKLLLDKNELLDRTQNEIYKPEKLSKIQAEDRFSTIWISSRNSLLISWNSRQMENMNWRKLLQESPKRRLAWFLPFPVPPPPPSELVIISAPPPPVFSLSPPPIPSLNPGSPSSPLPPHGSHVSPPSFYAPAERPSAPNRTFSEYHHQLLIVTSAIGGSLLLVILITGILFCYCGKMAPVKPWATGISGQLQRAFVTGVPKLKRSELEAACEDFSNVIGSSSVCTMYKGTLSNGVEIAVASIAVAVSSAKKWTTSQEAQFRKKIDTLLKVNHKNFVNLLGYCMEDEPFTRMLVFEYAPNGTLFEHLHVKESEHLDWPMRLRIAMGVAYCLEHMHQLTPTLVHRNLTSSTVYLAEDYAAKLSDFIYQDDGNAVDYEPTMQNNVYVFGVLLFEMMTGRLPHSVGGVSFPSDSLRVQNPREIVDPTLRTYDEEQLQQICDVIRLCTNPDPSGRPRMKEVCAMLREVSTVGPDEAVPKLSPLWWAELEILSAAAD